VVVVGCGGVACSGVRRGEVAEDEGVGHFGVGGDVDVEVCGGWLCWMFLWSLVEVFGFY